MKRFLTILLLSGSILLSGSTATASRSGIPAGLSVAAADSTEGKPLPLSMEQLKGKKVALVLCGGGAKGAAHIGVLKFLEECGLKVDMIVGTSIGGIVGGLYSIGYDAGTLKEIISGMDWGYVLSNNTLRKNMEFSQKAMDQVYFLQLPFYTFKADRKDNIPDNDAPAASLPSGMVNGQNILNLLTGLCGGYQDSTDFLDFPVPFCCVATDLETGEEAVLKDGYLPLSLRATMAIPGFFAPATINGRVLADGGMVNNFPVDVARSLGADIVIGVDIQNDLYKSEELKSITEIFSQIVSLMGNERYLNNVKDVDIYINPDVTGFSTYSFNSAAIDTLFERGYSAAAMQREAIEKLAKARAEAEGGLETLERDYRKASLVRRDTFYIAEIHCTGVSRADGEWLLKESGLRENSYVSGAEIDRAISILYGTNAFSSVTYKISRSLIVEDAQDLTLEFVKGPANILAVGARFDSEEAAAMLLHLGISTRDLFGSRLALTGRLSYNAYGKAEYSYVFKNFPKLNLSYMFKSTDMNIYSRGELSRYMSFLYHNAELSLSNMFLRNFDFSGGVRFEAFNYTHMLSRDDPENFAPDFNVKSFLSYFINAKMDNRDNRTFATRGVAFDASASVFQPEFSKKNAIFATVKLNLNGAIPLSGIMTLLPSVYYRSYIGHSLYMPYMNFAGGSEPGRYLSQQIPFMGINYAEEFFQNVIVGRIDLRGRIKENHYLYGIVNYMREGDVFENMFSRNGSGYWGTALKYVYNTRFGPLSVDCHWSDYNKKVGFYLSIGHYF